MNIFFIHHSAKKTEAEADEHSLVLFQNHEHNTNEGSEFLDDALRTEDLPESYTEENIKEENHNP